MSQLVGLPMRGRSGFSRCLEEGEGIFQQRTEILRQTTLVQHQKTVTQGHVGRFAGRISGNQNNGFNSQNRSDP